MAKVLNLYYLDDQSVYSETRYIYGPLFYSARKGGIIICYIAIHLQRIYRSQDAGPFLARWMSKLLMAVER